VAVLSSVTSQVRDMGELLALVIQENDQETLKAKFCTIRQQIDKDQDAFVAMSDFIAPKSSGKKDYLGFFAASAGFN